MPEPLELLVIGDVHGMWDEVDSRFVEGGAQAASIFVGDFGEEDLDLVRRIAGLACRKAVILGNHDAWYSMSGRDTTSVEKQLEALGSAHLSYASLAIGQGRVALVGGRPFTWGGGWSRHRALYRKLFEVEDDEASAARIVAAAAAHPSADLLLVGHNGPRGLGAGRDAIYGCDFREPHVDWGDADLALALARLRGEGGRRVIATIAGHMHDELSGGGRRRRVAVENGTVHLNAAVVPRHRDTAGGRLRHFLRVRIEERGVGGAEDLWIGDRGEVVEVAPLAIA